MIVRKPLSPYLVLALAILFPGAGHVAVGHPVRGLIFVLAVVLFGLLTFATTTPDHGTLTLRLVWDDASDK